MHWLSIHVYVAQPLRVFSVRVSRVKWRDDGAVYGAFAPFDHVARRLVKVFHASDPPARRRLTRQILIDKTHSHRTASKLRDELKNDDSQ